MASAGGSRCRVDDVFRFDVVQGIRLTFENNGFLRQDLRVVQVCKGLCMASRPGPLALRSCPWGQRGGISASLELRVLVLGCPHESTGHEQLHKLV